MSRRNIPRLGPTWLPLIRDRIVRSTLDLVDRAGDRYSEYASSMVDVGLAPLYWVTRDMTMLVRHAAEEDLPDPVLPSQTGFMAFAGGIKISVMSPRRCIHRRFRWTPDPNWTERSGWMR